MMIIDLDQVSKRYLLHQRRQLLSQHAWKQIRREVKSFWALRDVSFQLEEGERVGIIGANGAGKTTLLRLISGIAHPTSGAVRVHGRVGAVLGLGIGVHEDLTGRENIHLLASLMGLTRPEIRQRFDSIVEFSGLSTFIDEAVRAYSSGMVSRLGLSVAIHSDPEIPRSRRGLRGRRRRLYQEMHGQDGRVYEIRQDGRLCFAQPGDRGFDVQPGNLARPGDGSKRRPCW